MLGSFHHLCRALTRAAAILNCDAAGEEALDGASAEVHQNLRKVDFLQTPQEEEETLVKVQEKSSDM